MTAGQAIVTWDVQDESERLEGVPDVALASTLSSALDQVYALRSVFAHAALELKRALSYAGFARSRRQSGELQVSLLVRAASGDVDRVITACEKRRVEEAPKIEGISLPSRFAVPVLTPTGEANNPALRLAVCYAYREVFQLRQLATYAAGVVRNHDTPSGPKAVRAILQNIDMDLLWAARDPSATPRNAYDRADSLRRVGVPEYLTRSSYEKELGLN